MPILSASNVHKTYRLGRVDVPVLKGASVEVNEGEWVAVLGASGSGKSTLLHLLGGLDRPDRGRGSEITYRERDVIRFSARELDRYRANDVGFVFQFYHLLPELTVLENVLVGSMIKLGRIAYRTQVGGNRERAKELLDTLGLGHRLRHRPAEISGGERQRVAIARALINEPTVLLADEPTGNLDRETGDSILETLEGIRARTGQTIVMVTHDELIAHRADRVVRLADGLVEVDPPGVVRV